MLVTQYILLLLFGITSFFVLNPISNRVANRRIYLVVSFFILLMVAFRPSQMVDYEVYQMAFDGYLGFRFEPSFHLIKWIGILLGNVQFWGFFIYAYLCVWLKISYTKKYPTLLWSCMLVYLSSTIVTQDMVAIRAGVAGALMLFAIGYKIQADNRKMYIALIMAVLFHYSALACFVIPFLNIHKMHRNIYLSALLISHILALMGIFLNHYIGFLNSIGALETVLGMHTERDEPMNFLNLLQLGHILICVVLWMNAEKLKESYNDAIIYLKVYTIGLCVMPLLALMMSMAIRLQELFLVVEIILIPMGFSILFKSRLLGKYLLVIYSIVMFYFALTNTVYWGMN